MTSLEAILLGLVQGLTEFLPVSSSGHLTICKSLFGIETSNLSFEVAVHAATVLSTVVAFRKDMGSSQRFLQSADESAERLSLQDCCVNGPYLYSRCVLQGLC